MSYSPKNPIRIVTAASLFDGHDASINIIRRMLQDGGAEVIHLGHNRSVYEVVLTALQEDVQGICLSSYQGGHMEYFSYLKDLLKANGRDDIKIYGGGGGVIIPEEKKALEALGIDYIFHIEDGRKLGLLGMVDIIIKGCDFSPLGKDGFKKDGLLKSSQKTFEQNKSTLGEKKWNWILKSKDLGRALSFIEQDLKLPQELKPSCEQNKAPLVLGVTGTGGAGKSSLVDEILFRFLRTFDDPKIAVICVDPTKKKTGGALLGDRIRMNCLSSGEVFMRSMASRGSGSELSSKIKDVVEFLKTRDFDLIFVESSGIGQSGSAIMSVGDFNLYAMTSDFGAQSQLEKIDMIDYADFVAVNKADRRGAKDAFHDVTKQYKRSRKIFDRETKVPVFLTQASHFNDKGVNELFYEIVRQISKKNPKWKIKEKNLIGSQFEDLIPPERQGHLARAVEVIKKYHQTTKELSLVADEIWALEKLWKSGKLEALKVRDWILELKKKFKPEDLETLENFKKLQSSYKNEELTYTVRDQKVTRPLVRESLSGVKIPRVAVPELENLGSVLKFCREENFPGHFPFTGGVFPLKRSEEEPTRQFAGEGPPERTNKRFRYLSQNSEVKRLSTAFDSVTLYGEDPDPRPDIFGKVGESGVSIATIEDMHRLYEGFDLCDPKTSVSMTINGPAPIILAFFLNVAWDQQRVKKEEKLGRALTQSENEKLLAWVLVQVRGTVQADILKEDQGQNTCIFSVGFALKMMADIQEYFIHHKVRNFYSVSISGYHIAEAGANPISQLAFTLSNALTFVEYYLQRGLKIDEFAPNLSFFFSNGLDPEYTVIGRVARRIWAIVVRDLYGGGVRAQKLKYHIQTSGRSLHAQEIQYNDIRTTLQALLAIEDHCNSLHTNAYDEAITTPTKESVKRAQAIQMIINKELGLVKNENPLQGSYFISWLTDKVEALVLEEFLRIHERGGVLAAMETQYQRSKIQSESHHYESLKHSGRFPIVGVNTFLSEDGEQTPTPDNLARSTSEEKSKQLKRVLDFKKARKPQAPEAIKELKTAILQGENSFKALMKACRVLSLGQMTKALYEIGGQYRRNI